MDKAKFGSSDLEVSKIGLGLAALGRPGYINLGHGEDLNHTYDTQQMEQQTHAMLDEASKLGINYFDAAQSYGKAEQFLSSWLKKTTQQRPVVGSKWGYYYTADWSVGAKHHEIKEHTLERLNLQWPSSDQRLSPHLKIYQIHSATFESGVLENKEVLGRLAEIRDEGIIIGLSVSGPQQAEVIEEALKVSVEGQLLFGSVQATFNVLDQSASDALKRAHDLGLGVIVKEGVANGRLTAKNQSAPFMNLLNELSDTYNSSPDAIALSYILHQPFVNIVLSGAAQIDHLRSNVAACSLDLTQKNLADLNALKISPEQYWDERSSLEWN